jgi:hypothetical protein
MPQYTSYSQNPPRIKTINPRALRPSIKNKLTDKLPSRTTILNTPTCMPRGQQQPPYTCFANQWPTAAYYRREIAGLPRDNGAGAEGGGYRGDVVEDVLAALFVALYEVGCFGEGGRCVCFAYSDISLPFSGQI